MQPWLGCLTCSCLVCKMRTVNLSWGWNKLIVIKCFLVPSSITIIIVMMNSLICFLKWFSERHHNNHDSVNAFLRGPVWHAKLVWFGAIFRVFRSGMTVYIHAIHANISEKFHIFTSINLANTDGQGAKIIFPCA